jgi:hypothetical protein
LALKYAAYAAALRGGFFDLNDALPFGPMVSFFDNTFFSVEKTVKLCSF